MKRFCDPDSQNVRTWFVYRWRRYDCAPNPCLLVMRSTESDVIDFLGKRADFYCWEWGPS